MEDEGEFAGVLAEHRLSRNGLHVKLDKGFEEGTYCVYLELRCRVRYVTTR